MAVYWIITGRIPYDDEDSLKIIQADTMDEATEVFREVMLEENGGESTETDEDGPVVYVNNYVKVISDAEPVLEWSSY